MKRWMVILVVIGGLAVLWAWRATRPVFDFDSMAETPAMQDSPLAYADNISTERFRVTPPVKLDAPTSAIRWPAFRTSYVIAPPLRLTVRRDQWSSYRPLSDSGFIGPASVGLALDWPEPPESRAQARANEEPVRVDYLRARDDRDLLYRGEFRSRDSVVFVTPMDAPREEAVMLSCAGMHCLIQFEHLGRRALVEFPKRRVDDWKAGYAAARAVLREVAAPY